jgi:hypothetical protein
VSDREQVSLSRKERGGHLKWTGFFDFVCQTSSKSLSFFGAWGGDVGQKPGFQKTNQMEDIHRN